MLAEELKNTTEQQVCADLIAKFSEDYMVMVTSIDEYGIPILGLSSPFVSMKNVEIEKGQISVNGEIIAFSRMLDGIPFHVIYTPTSCKLHMETLR